MPGAQAYNFIKKETMTKVFSCEFCEISKNTFFTEHAWANASVFCGTKINMKGREILYLQSVS